MQVFLDYCWIIWSIHTWTQHAHGHII